MGDLILYLAFATVGYIIGIKANRIKEKFKWTGTAQTVAISVLVASMGLRMGSNREVIKNLGSIGISSLLMTVFVIFFSIFFLFVTRKILKINRHGMMDTGNVNMEISGDDQNPEGKLFDTMTMIILSMVSVGFLGGFIISKQIEDTQGFGNIMGYAIKVGLCVLLFFVGLDMGFDGTVFQNLKKVGLRVLMVPIAVIAGSIFGAVLCSFILPLSLKESAAVASGLGWYSLAPGIMMDQGYSVAGAVSFLHNVFREMLSFILIPMVAKKIGYMETVAIPGAAAMDVCLPLVSRYTNGEVAVCSLISGVVLSSAVPILVPLVLSL